ncbi:MAG: glycosyltransferase family 2 protein, partial [Pseudonocardia sp.]
MIVSGFPQMKITQIPGLDLSNGEILLDRAAAAAAVAVPIASVVVPAHNEAELIGRCLDRILADAAPGEIDVVVVANGCTDDTAGRARARGVRVIETVVANKIHAVELGDGSCSVYPRLYIDADVELDTVSLRALVGALAEPGVLACAPRPVWNLAGTGPVVRRVHSVHDVLIDRHRALSGVGVYVLSRQGHDRVFPLPDVVADDEWVHRNFSPVERRVVATARSVVAPARTLRAHLRRRVRCRVGNRQLEQMGRAAPHGRVRLGELGTLVARRRVKVLDATCYLLVAILDKARTAARAARGAA